MSPRRAARRAPRAPAQRADSSCSRPKYRSASPTPAGGRPKYGHSGLAARNTRSDRSDGILPEDRLLQLGELGARIQSELGSEQPPRPAHGGERIRLPTLAVLRHAQHDPAPLAQRCFGDAGARQCGDLLNLACLEPCVQEQLLDAETHLLETAGRDLSRLPVGEFDEGLAPPQRERLRERVRGTFGLTELQLLRTPRDESLEPLGVDLDVLRGSVGTRAGWSRSAPAR